MGMEYAYFMSVNVGKGKRELYDPSPEEIDRAINELIPAPYHFVFMQSKARVENCDYIQTIIDDDHETLIRYCVEVRFQYTDNYPGDHKQCQLMTTDADNVKKMFRMFALGIVPNVDGWTDITEELAEKAKEGS